MQTKSILLAGSTGYLGTYVLKELLKQGYKVICPVRNPQKIDLKTLPIQYESQLELIQAEVTKPQTLINICKDIDTVITTVGITRQKDGLTYQDVDYQANLNILQEAKLSKVKKFIYISAFKGNHVRYLKIMEAKEKFVDELQASQGIQYCIVRPTGFFSDMKDFLDMAKDGRVYVFGNGQNKMNPIHGEDLAIEIVKRVEIEERGEFNIGGPEVFTHRQLGECALRAWGKNLKITKLCDCLRKWAICCLRCCTSQKVYGPPEFFLTCMSFDMEAPCYGRIKLQDFFNGEVQKIKEEEKQKKNKK